MPSIDIDGLRIDYDQAGVGLPIVFVPGLVGSKEWFCYQQSGLSDRYRVISIDLRRAGGRRQYLVDALAEDIARFIERMRLGAAAVAGHELGALIAMRLAASHPERCSALVLASPAPSFSGLSEQQLLQLLAPTRIEVNTFLTRVRKLFAAGKDAPAEPDEDRAYLAANNAGLSRKTLRARLRLLQQTDLTPVLSEITAPTLVIGGALDDPRLLEGAQAVERLIPDSTIEILDGADHFCFYTRHDLFNAAVDEFLARAIPSL